MNKAATFIYVIFNSLEPIIVNDVEETYERRSFTELMINYNERLLREIKKVLAVKPLFKARLRLHIWITGAEEKSGLKLIGKHFDSGHYEDVFEVIVVTKDHKIINRTNYEEELTNLILELDSRRSVIFGGNSKWKLLKFFSLSYDTYMKIKQQDQAHV